METKSKFKKLLAQTNALTETEAGKLRGGVTVLSTKKESLEHTNSGVCLNIGCTVKQSINKQD